MTVTDELRGPLNAFRLAIAPQDGVWSPIEDERRRQAAADAAHDLARLLLARVDMFELAEV